MTFASVPFAVSACPSQAIAGASPGVVGVSAFVQQSREFQHTRLVGGADYAGNWGQASLNLFVPTTGWRPGRRGYVERALAGIELGVGLELTTTLSMSAAIGQWEDDDGLGGWSTNGRMAVGWRPHPWLSLGVAWNGLGTQSDAQVYRLAFSMPLGGTREPPRWTGLGLVGGGSSPSCRRPVETCRERRCDPGGAASAVCRKPRRRSDGPVSPGKAPQPVTGSALKSASRQQPPAIWTWL